MLIGASEDPSVELGIELGRERESAESADLFRLQIDPEKSPARPMLERECE